MSARTLFWICLQPLPLVVASGSLEVWERGVLYLLNGICIAGLVYNAESDAASDARKARGEEA